MFKERIKRRQRSRSEIARFSTVNRDENTIGGLIFLISESLDDYIEHRIETDKVLEGILKDIQGNIVEMTDLDRIMEKTKIFLAKNIEK